MNRPWLYRAPELLAHGYEFAPSVWLPIPKGQPPKILIAGCQGALGSKLLSLARSMGWDAIGLCRGEPKFDEKLRIVRFPAENWDDAARMLPRGWTPDRCIGVQGMTGASGSLDSFLPANVESFQKLSKLCHGLGCGLVCAGTLSVFVSQTNPPPALCEEKPLDRDGLVFNGAYAASKWMSETAALDAGHCVCRLGLLAADTPPEGEFLASAIQALLWVQTIPEPSDDPAAILHDLSSASEAARQLLFAASRDENPGLFHCAANRPISLAEWIEKKNETGFHSEFASPSSIGQRLLARAFERQGPQADRAGRLFNWDLFQTTGTRFQTEKIKHIGLPQLDVDDARAAWTRRIGQAVKT